MREIQLPVRRSLPSRWAVIVLLACIVASLFITLRAAAQNPATKPEAAPKTTTAAPKPAAAPRAEESATITDDPTLVPDPKESADNNVTFPVDI